MPGTSFKIIDYGSPEYQASLDLRESVLRKPLGLSLSADDTASDHLHAIAAGLIDDTLVATATIVTRPERQAQIRQVAVCPQHRNQGLGGALMGFCEDRARAMKCETVYVHARETAINFYRKIGYHIEGDAFTEQGIPHFKMRKPL